MVCVFSAVLCGGSVGAQERSGAGTITAVPGDDRWQWYRNGHLGFEVQYPKTWKVESTGPYGNSVRFVPPSGDMISEFSFGLAQPVRDAWFRDFAVWMRKYKRDLTATGARIRGEAQLDVSGYQAVRLTYADNLPGKTKSTVIDTLIGVPGIPQGRVFEIIYGPPKSRRHQAQQDATYRRILSSLKITAER